MSQNQNQNERWAFSIQEVAEKICVSSRTVHTLIKSGALPHVRIGTRVLVPTSTLREFIASRVQAKGSQSSLSNNEKETQS